METLSYHAVLTAICVMLLAAMHSHAAAQAGAATEGMTLDPRVESRPDLPMGPFVNLSDGAILTVSETDALISRDGGHTWAPQPMFSPGQNLKISNERALLRTRNGAIIVVFMNMTEFLFRWDEAKRAPEPECRLDVWSVRSLDDGKTWVDAQRMYRGYCGAIRDMIQTRSGHVVAPVQEMLYDEARHATRGYVSTDDGKTWTKTNLLDIGGRGHHGGLMEATVVELRDGRLWMLLRTNLERFWSAYSDDEGFSWRVFQPSDIPASSSPGLLRRLKSGRLILLWNRPLPEGATDYPRVGGDGQWSEVPVRNHREELSVAFSEDDGRTWGKPVVLARKPKTSLAYPYLFEPQPGELWITTMQGGVRVGLREADFVGK